MPQRALLFLLLVGGMALGGCTTSEKKAEKLLTLGWVGPTPQARKKLETPKALYCYETIGEPECYGAERPEWAHRLINFYGPAAAKTSLLPAPQEP